MRGNNRENRDLNLHRLEDLKSRYDLKFFLQ
jgi:hypothetical protein